MADLRIQISQINPVVGDLSNNLDKISSEIEYARTEGVDILVFPEFALTGSPLKNLIYDKNFLDECNEAMSEIVKISGGITLSVGSVYSKNDAIYSSCFVIEDKRIVDMVSKVLPTRTSIYDEKSYLSIGDGYKMFRKRGIPYALVVGNDISIIARFSEVSVTPNEPALVLHSSAFPYEIWRLAFHYEGIAKLVDDWRWHYIRANLVGGQDEIVYFGGSFAWDTKKGLTNWAPYFKEGRLTVDVISTEKGYEISPITQPTPLKERGIGEIYEALVLAVRDYFHKNNFKKAVVGVSGGIDSAVTLAIVSDALGPENCYGVLLPTRYTAEESKDDAVEVMNNLGVNSLAISIDGLYSELKSDLELEFDNKLGDITDQNIQARLRGVILMAIANQRKAIVVATGNKSEVSVGYCTLYGDTVGGFAPLKDIYKTNVWKLAEYRNSLTDVVIPERIIEKPPSAELKVDQVDEDDIPRYEILDEILKAYIEDGKDIAEIERMGIERRTIEKVYSMIFESQFKREQSAIGPNLKPYNDKNLSDLPVTNRFRIE